MDFIAVKDLKAPAELRQTLARAGEVVVTNNGRPMAVMVPVDDSGDAEAIVMLFRQARMRLAISRIRRAARATGVDKLSAAEIDGEIKAARRSRKK